MGGEVDHNKVKHLCLYLKATKLILKPCRPDKILSSAVRHVFSSGSISVFKENSKGAHRIYRPVLPHEEVRGNFGASQPKDGS